MDSEFDRKYDIFSRVQDANNLEAIWSIHEVIDTESDFQTVVHPHGVKIIYEPYGFDQVEQTLSGPVTILDLWKAADRLIKLSGDHHHVFVEAFTDRGDGVIKLHFNVHGYCHLSIDIISQQNYSRGGLLGHCASRGQEALTTPLHLPR